METTGIIRVICYIGIIGGLFGVYWGYFGMMEKKMETTIV